MVTKILKLSVLSFIAFSFSAKAEDAHVHGEAVLEVVIDDAGYAIYLAGCTSLLFAVAEAFEVASPREGGVVGEIIAITLIIWCEKQLAYVGKVWKTT